MTDFWDDVPEASGVLAEASMAVSHTYFRRLGREVTAAWMAGYAVLDVINATDDPPKVDVDDWNAALAVQVAFIPGDGTGIAAYPDADRVERIDLTGLSLADIQGIRESWGDDG